MGSSSNFVPEAAPRTPRGVVVSQTSMRHRAIVIALFVTALVGAMVTMGTFGFSSAHAQSSSSCDISKFKNPDGSLDTTGYLACVQAASVSAPKPAQECPT